MLLEILRLDPIILIGLKVIIITLHYELFINFKGNNDIYVDSVEDVLTRRCMRLQLNE